MGVVRGSGMELLSHLQWREAPSAARQRHVCLLDPCTHEPSLRAAAPPGRDVPTGSHEHPRSARGQAGNKTHPENHRRDHPVLNRGFREEDSD